MGWINRFKLNALSISSDADLHPCESDGTVHDMIRITMSMLGGLPTPSKVIEIGDKLKKYSDMELRKKFSKSLLSLEQADAYMIERKAHWERVGYSTAWKTHKGILIDYTSSLLGLWIPAEFIVRTSETSWIAWNVPFFGNDTD